VIGRSHESLTKEEQDRRGAGRQASHWAPIPSATIAARLASRHHRYMPATLLDSQFATLEPPKDAIDIDVANSVDEQVREIVEALGVAPSR